MIARVLLLTLTLLLAGCDLETLLADPKIAQREAEAKAIGGACRYGMRGIEDCYAMNEKASKAAVFNGWKEMDQYMRDNKIDGVPSKLGDAKDIKSDALAPGEEVVDTKAGKDSKAAKKADKTEKTATKSKPTTETASTKKAEAADQ